MKVKSKKSIRRVIAFVSALTIVTSATMLTGFADKKTEVVNHVDDYTSLFPGLTDTKMKLSDPVFSEKDWYEYIEYEFYTEVIDGDMTYRIYKPTDFGEASIMAIGDYNPKEILGNTTNLSMNLGELQGIFDMAQQGSNISKDFVGLDITSGIAENMNNIGEVMDNSKYYSQSSFLGIPGDKKYTGVSNDGFFNADSLEIEIVESETISTCKTIAMDSSYSISESSSSVRDHATYSEVGQAKTNTKEESESIGASSSVGSSMGQEIVDSYESGVTISEAISKSMNTEITETFADTVGKRVGTQVGSSITAGVGVDAGVSGEVGLDLGVDVGVGANVGANVNISGTISAGISTENSVEHSHEVSKNFSVGSETSHGLEKSESISKSIGTNISTNIEESKFTEYSKLESNSIENSLVNGKENRKSEGNAKEMAVDVGYGVDYQYGNEHSLSIGVTRIFNAREDEDVKNVGWKLCEYVVKIPYYIEAVKTDAMTGEENILYGQYVNYNLLNGVCRVFTNGYIEHWYTGELVAYADFFDGFVTATELVDKAKAQQAEKADMLS